MWVGRAEGPRNWPLSLGSDFMLNISVPYFLNCPPHTWAPGLLSPSLLLAHPSWQGQGVAQGYWG